MVASGPLPLDRASLDFHLESCPILPPPPSPRDRACAEGGLNTRYL